MFLQCEICNQYINSDYLTHVCDKENIKNYVKHLTEIAQKASNRTDDIQNSVYALIAALPEFKDEIIVKAELIRNLWNAAKCNFFCSSADDFHTRWMALHEVFIRASDLFDSNIKKLTNLEKLQQLKDACIFANKKHKYEGKFDLNPEEVIR